jgi:hypothetical protein
VIVVCVYSAAQPNEVQIAVGDGAGTLQVVTAERLLREEAERLLTGDGQLPESRGQEGSWGPFEDVGSEDVLITVTWPEEGPQLDYSASKVATVDQLLAAAMALNEYGRFGVWDSRYSQKLAVMQQQMQMAQAAEARDRAGAAIVRAAHLPPSLREIGQA